MPPARLYLLFFFFNDPATTEIYTLSLHDALPILNTTFGKSTNDRYGARNMAKPVNFYCSAPTAQSVHLVGDFNGWNPLAHPMHRQLDGCWFLQVLLTHGHHRYPFLVDAEPLLDPRRTPTTPND